VQICRPANPEAKGLIERAHDYLERSFLPGRTFASPADFTTQPQAWLAVVNTRVRRALGCAPVDRIAADRAAMLTVTPVAPVTGWRSATRLARDHSIRLDSNDYSVHPSVIGRRVEIIGDPLGVRVFREGKLVADHDRLWTRHQTVSDPEHLAAAKALRRERIGLVRPVREPEVETRCAWPTTTPPWAWKVSRARKAGWPDGNQDHIPGPGRGSRVCDPGAQGTLGRASRLAGSRGEPGPSPGRMRSSWWPARNGKSPRGSPTAARAVSAPPGSPPASRWRNSTSITPAASNAK
jgi:hypothetical protein